MSDLIRREDAIDALKKIMFTHLFENGEYIGEDTREVSIMNAEKALDVIENLPSAEQERRKGEWRHLGGDEWCCTNCGYIVSTGWAWEHPKEQGKDYCEHCGSDMRSE